jgi:hypothetical protein
MSDRESDATARRALAVSIPAAGAALAGASVGAWLRQERVERNRGSLDTEGPASGEVQQ